ncbi:MAG TPA: hypothetical protein VFT12_01120 [Thermoanaerobaculia bacterium]|nr:hypothetical protein [Thermoanaerobaculia bacterium]
MKTFMLILVLAAGGETKDLVEAAQEAKAKRKGPPVKVITNADVKNAKGKLIELPAPPDQKDTEKKKKEPGPSALQQHDANYRKRLELDQKVIEAQKKVADLEKELEAVESRYYEENDPDRRDRVIRQQFLETQEALAKAVGELKSLIPESQPEAEKPNQ